jgi:DNA-binding PadR family transcriptional regulator
MAYYSEIRYFIMECCGMKGYLSFLILWILKKGNLTGQEIARELQKRRGAKPSPGTIYPALKELNEKGLISFDAGKKYSLTKKGEKELQTACGFFCKTFYDIEDIFTCCQQKPKRNLKTP